MGRPKAQHELRMPDSLPQLIAVKRRKGECSLKYNMNALKSWFERRRSSFGGIEVSEADILRYICEYRRMVCYKNKKYEEVYTRIQDDEDGWVSNVWSGDSLDTIKEASVLSRYTPSKRIMRYDFVDECGEKQTIKYKSKGNNDGEVTRLLKRKKKLLDVNNEYINIEKRANNDIWFDKDRGWLATKRPLSDFSDIEYDQEDEEDLNSELDDSLLGKRRPPHADLLEREFLSEIPSEPSSFRANSTMSMHDLTSTQSQRGSGGVLMEVVKLMHSLLETHRKEKEEKAERKAAKHRKELEEAKKALDEMEAKRGVRLKKRVINNLRLVKKPAGEDIIDLDKFIVKKEEYFEDKFKLMNAREEKFNTMFMNVTTSEGDEVSYNSKGVEEDDIMVCPEKMAQLESLRFNKKSSVAKRPEAKFLKEWLDLSTITSKEVLKTPTKNPLNATAQGTPKKSLVQEAIDTLIGEEPSQPKETDDIEEVV